MDEIICYTSLLPPGEARQLSFWDILMDDRWAEGQVECPDVIYQEIGNVNQKIRAKQNYEFLLRAAEQYPVKAIGSLSTATQSNNSWDAFCTDCYIVGKYSELLQKNDCFNLLVSTLVAEASQMPQQAEGIVFLEKMISHASEYYSIDDDTRPILLYRDTDTCNNVLNLFTDSLASALHQCRQRVEIFDTRSEDTQALTKYIGQRFKAIVGIQSYFFAIMMQDGVTNLHDLIIGPKYNMILDHPAWLKDEINRAPKDYYLLLHDRNYMAFASRHFPGISGCIHFPPAGLLPDTPPIPMADRKYNISFIGTYRNYRERLSIIRKYDRTHRRIAARYLMTMKKNPCYPAEKALDEVVKYYKLTLSKDQFLQLFYDMRQVYFCIMLYYREKVIQTLLDAQIQLDVFSDSWQNAPFATHPCLSHHTAVDAKLSLQIMQDSRISLNIMSWHKDGLTERILNSMLCQSVVLSDYTTALSEQFKDQQELVLFSLEQLSTLPDKVKALLSDNEELQAIALNGYDKALKEHTWLRRAELLLKPKE